MVLKTQLKSTTTDAGECAWCEKGECWTHGQIEKPKSQKGKGRGNWKGGGGDLSQVLMSLLGGGGSSKGGGSWGGGGRDKGISRSTTAEKKVWIGGLSAGSRDQAGKDLNKELQQHMKQAGDCKFAEVTTSGTGSACYSTTAEVATAIEMLNGTVFRGATIEVDSWTKKEK